MVYIDLFWHITQSLLTYLYLLACPGESSCLALEDKSFLKVSFDLYSIGRSLLTYSICLFWRICTCSPVQGRALASRWRSSPIDRPDSSIVVIDASDLYATQYCVSEKPCVVSKELCVLFTETHHWSAQQQHCRDWLERPVWCSPFVCVKKALYSIKRWTESIRKNIYIYVTPRKEDCTHKDNAPERMSRMRNRQ